MCADALLLLLLLLLLLCNARWVIRSVCCFRTLVRASLAFAAAASGDPRNDAEACLCAPARPVVLLTQCRIIGATITAPPPHMRESKCALPIARASAVQLRTSEGCPPPRPGAVLCKNEGVDELRSGDKPTPTSAGAHGMFCAVAAC